VPEAVEVRFSCVGPTLAMPAFAIAGEDLSLLNQIAVRWGRAGRLAAASRAGP